MTMSSTTLVQLDVSFSCSLEGMNSKTIVFTQSLSQIDLLLPPKTSK